MRLAAVQRGEAGQQVYELAAGRRRHRRLHPLVPPPYGRGARWRHGVDNQRRPRGSVGKVPLARRRGQRAVA